MKLSLLFALAAACLAQLPSNQWTRIVQDPSGSRRNSAIRYAPGAGAFFLWGFFDHDPELLQEMPVMEVPEYDMVAFDPAANRWSSHFPRERQKEWSQKLPLAYIPRTYAAITTGSERTIFRSPTNEQSGVPRPDLNIVFDQVAWFPPMRSLVYFTGGLTAAYDPRNRRWTDLEPRQLPPPVAGGSLAFNPVASELLLFGGGHVVEQDASGHLAGYTGTWIFKDGDWQQLSTPIQPPPRMNTRMVTDTRNNVIILFAGDGQSRYLADTWIFDMKTRTWRESKTNNNPPPRAGHFTVYDPQSGLVLIGGGYNRADLTDMWAYDAAADRWFELPAKVPTGFHISADIAPEQHLILLTTATKRPGDKMTCNELYPVRTTYGFRLDSAALKTSAKPAQRAHPAMVKREPLPAPATQVNLSALPANQWTLLSSAEHGAPVRTWGSATFDTNRSEILYWGGGHCGYGGSDVDAFTVESNRWRVADTAPEFPERAWNKGSRPAGVTFSGGPWTDHGRRIYAYDPTSKKMIMMRTIRMAAGYDPPAISTFPAEYAPAADAIVQTPSSYVRHGTYSYDSQNGQWTLLTGAPKGLDTLVSTPKGAAGVVVDWRSRLNDAGYLLPWSARTPHRDAATYLFDANAKTWNRIDKPGPAPQNLYEMTSLAYDTKRGRLFLHGGGADRTELWSLDFTSGQWTNLKPSGPQPTTNREAVYLPDRDVLLISGPDPQNRERLAIWAYSPSANAWTHTNIAFAGAVPRGAGSQNRAMVYDPAHDVVLLLIGGNENRAAVYGLRYKP